MIRSSQESTVSSLKKYSGETRANVIAVVSADVCAYEDSGGPWDRKARNFVLQFSKDISAGKSKISRENLRLLNYLFY